MVENDGERRESVEFNVVRQVRPFNPVNRDNEKKANVTLPIGYAFRLTLTARLPEKNWLQLKNKIDLFIDAKLRKNNSSDH